MTLWHCCQDGGSTPPISTIDLRVGEMVTRLAHNQKIGGSIPPPATKIKKNRMFCDLSHIYIRKWLQKIIICDIQKHISKEASSLDKLIRLIHNVIKR